MHANDFKGLNEEFIRVFAIQILNSLNFLSRMKIIHCDIKPENIVLKVWGKSGIKLIDFGTSCFQGISFYINRTTIIHLYSVSLLSRPIDLVSKGIHHIDWYVEFCMHDCRTVFRKTTISWEYWSSTSSLHGCFAGFSSTTVVSQQIWGIKNKRKKILRTRWGGKYHKGKHSKVQIRNWLLPRWRMLNSSWKKIWRSLSLFALHQTNLEMEPKG